MDFAYTDEEGSFLVRLSRQALTEYLNSRTKIPIPADCPPKLKIKSGVFVTLNIFNETKTEHQLRGCIGRPTPELPLVQATIDSAIDAGTRDPRFGRVILKDLKDIQFEATVLTPPEVISAKTIPELLAAIEIGRDGLMIKGGRKYYGAGLFLPQVPVEWHWDKEEYLTELCGKAGIPSNAWKDLPNVTIYRFRGEIFEEDGPNGNIKRILLEPSN